MKTKRWTRKKKEHQPRRRVAIGGGSEHNREQGRGRSIHGAAYHIGVIQPNHTTSKPYPILSSYRPACPTADSYRWTISAIEKKKEGQNNDGVLSRVRVDDTLPYLHTPAHPKKACIEKNNPRTEEATRVRVSIVCCVRIHPIPPTPHTNTRQTPQDASIRSSTFILSGPPKSKQTRRPSPPAIFLTLPFFYLILSSPSYLGNILLFLFPTFVFRNKVWPVLAAHTSLTVISIHFIFLPSLIHTLISPAPKARHSFARFRPFGLALL